MVQKPFETFYFWNNYGTFERFAKWNELFGVPVDHYAGSYVVDYLLYVGMSGRVTK